MNLEQFEDTDLYLFAKAIEVMRYIMQDLENEYFFKYNSAKKEDHLGILYDFSRNKARADVIGTYLLNLHKRFEELNIDWQQ